MKFRNYRTLNFALITSFILLSLSGCGGGGGSDTSTNTEDPALVSQLDPQNYSSTLAELYPSIDWYIQMLIPSNWPISIYEQIEGIRESLLLSAKLDSVSSDQSNRYSCPLGGYYLEKKYVSGQSTAIEQEYFDCTLANPEHPEEQTTLTGTIKRQEDWQTGSQGEIPFHQYQETFYDVQVGGSSQGNLEAHGVIILDNQEDSDSNFRYETQSPLFEVLYEHNYYAVADFRELMYGPLSALSNPDTPDTYNHSLSGKLVSSVIGGYTLLEQEKPTELHANECGQQGIQTFEGSNGASGQLRFGSDTGTGDVITIEINHAIFYRVSDCG